MIVEVLKRHASREKPLNQMQIWEKLRSDYPHLSAEITIKKVRASVKKIVEQEESLANEADKVLRYVGGKRKEGCWAKDNVSDAELRFLIDCVVYSSIINTPNARDLAKRLQGLSGKRLLDMTPYASGAFGEQKYTPDIDVLKHVEEITEARKAGHKIRFDLNVYVPENGDIVLRPVERSPYTVSPLETVLHDGRYYLLACYDSSDKVYTFRIDLMTDIQQTEEKARHDIPPLKNFRRDAFMLQHPVMYGGEARRFTLRVQKDSLTRVVDAFSQGLRIVPGSETEDDTVDLWVTVADEAMRLWLLRYGDIVEAVDLPKDFADKLKQSVEALYQKYFLKK